jgi:hypothetical protein
MGSQCATPVVDLSCGERGRGPAGNYSLLVQGRKTIGARVSGSWWLPSKAGTVEQAERGADDVSFSKEKKLNTGSALD